MTRILAIAGSLRAASFNAALLRAAVAETPEGTTLDIGDMHGVPLYDGDLEETEGLPAQVVTLQGQLAAADGLLLVSPEYNGSIPGVLKNTLDWMSRGKGLAAFKGKPVAVIGASPGGFGTVLAQAHWAPVMRSLGMRPWHDARLMVSRAGNVFDADLNLTDGAVRKQLADYLAGYAASLR
ncbi:NADPH-dependent FMN reductase [Ketogulonicigenium vulgare]|uniref:NADPH-dependent FMN reductase n=1 Tax=Ketogulonicigenium vulgare TaxID=92945 RepID=UPI0023592390|nr:NADPH-dependent FMN reductase [Ketogulonicigenium vulgare]